MGFQLVLVTGASGGKGGQTGRHVSKMLLAQLVAVRALVHTFDERLERLHALNLDPETARTRFAITDSIETLGGAQPKTLAAFVRAAQGTFGRQL